MEEGFPFHLALPDVLISLLSLLFFLLDVVLDLWAIDCLYKEEKYSSMGLLIFFLLSSSILVQTYSWLWYSDSSVTLDTKVERFIKRHGLMAPVHICQLSVFLRFAAVLEISICRFNQSDRFSKGLTMYMIHDLSTLRLFEAFSESASQLVLMTALIFEMQEMQHFTVIKIIGSLFVLTFSVLSYHHNMRAFLPEKLGMGWLSSVIYFLWNLFLISPRVVCVSLVASVLPCLIAAHFLSLWTLLVLWAWWEKTDFMDTKAGEWLYRATVGLIWYFSWFNVTSGNTKLRGIIYHVVMGADNALLLGLWWWWRSVESARLSPFPINPYILIGLLVIIYITGVLLKLVYYWKCHPNKPVLDINLNNDAGSDSLELDSSETLEPKPEPEVTVLVGINKRIRHMAVNFYC
ncbi:XK-related protein 8-like [Clarias gariepinus]|uniref:XK-related protein 8-like n=1 Tax=Clarias gariepinus TaxID=13013 RepID=UPI00234DE9CD|nr:XK-related protein 8-like [Clarias gariepinus]